MRKIALLSLFAMLFALTATFATAQCPNIPNFACSFYAGDLDLNDPNQNGLANENDAIVGGSPYGAATFQNFNWGGGLVDGLFTNNLSGLNPASAYWEIRTGVSEGNGGTLIASGTASGGNFSSTATGRADFGFNEYSYAALNLNTFLGAGQYWFAVVPQDTGNANRSFNSDTDGLNSIGSQTSGLQYFDSAFFGANYTNANNEGVFNIFSGGVLYATPEPSSLIMLGSGLLVAAGAFRRRFM
ncbi:MAG: PEP-CTERM sorting domain-containing protein [Candidatus Korobacteraceae bacterium]